LALKYSEGYFQIGCIIGVSVLYLSDSNVEMVIKRADRALYVAKSRGRGQVYGFGGRGIAGSNDEQGILDSGLRTH